MKRLAVLLLAVLVTSLAIGGCSATATSANNGATVLATEQPSVPAISLDGKEVVEIREKMFLAQLNDIYLNMDDYVGKVIKYQGMYLEEPYGEAGEIYRCVYRNSPGCCGADGQAGFEIALDQTPPQNNDWVEVVGVLEYYEESGTQYPRIHVASLTVLTERGAEYVTQ